jgi:thioredoxin-like negative regulator of GroEL
MEYQIRSIPMQMFLAKGQTVDHILGSVPEDMIRSKVADVLKRFSPDTKGQV